MKLTDVDIKKLNFPPYDPFSYHGLRMGSTIDFNCGFHTIGITQFAVAETYSIYRSLELSFYKIKAKNHFNQKKNKQIDKMINFMKTYDEKPYNITSYIHRYELFTLLNVLCDKPLNFNLPSETEIRDFFSIHWTNWEPYKKMRRRMIINEMEASRISVLRRFESEQYNKFIAYQKEKENTPIHQTKKSFLKELIENFKS